MRQPLRSPSWLNRISWKAAKSCEWLSEGKTSSLRKTQFQWLHDGVTLHAWPLRLGFSDSNYADCYRSAQRGEIASVRPIGFALHCRRNKSRLGPTRRARGQMSTTTVAGGRENRDFRLPAVLFRCGRQTSALSACTREIRRDPDDFRWSVDGCVEGSIRIHHCGILNSFFASTAACHPDCALQSWSERVSKCAKIVHFSVVSYREWMYEFQNWSEIRVHHSCFIIAMQRAASKICENLKLRNGYGIDWVF